MLDLLARDLLAAAPAMLGMHLVRGGRRARIVEAEAYRASDDPASHAYRGITQRTAVMFGPPGLAYVYFSYGAHWMLNVTALLPGSAGAILIRAAEPLEGLDEMFTRRPKARKPQDLLSGPGKLAPAFDITRADNGVDLFAPYRQSPPEALLNRLHAAHQITIGPPPPKDSYLHSLNIISAATITGAIIRSIICRRRAITGTAMRRGDLITRGATSSSINMDRVTSAAAAWR